MIFGSAIIGLFVSVFPKKFGQQASGKSLAAMQQSPHCKNGNFQNLNHT
jgi:hypothetical protein